MSQYAQFCCNVSAFNFGYVTGTNKQPRMAPLRHTLYMIPSHSYYYPLSDLNNLLTFPLFYLMIVGYLNC